MSLEMRTKLMEKAKNAVSQAQQFLVELNDPTKNHAEARAAELNTSYQNAFNDSKRFKQQADDDLAMETMSTEIREFGERPVTTPGRQAGAPVATPSNSLDFRTLDGRVYVPYDQVQQQPNIFAELRGAEAELLRAIPEWPVESRNAFSKFLHKRRDESLPDIERRALTPYLDPEGGYWISREMRAELIRQERNLVQIRKVARVLQTNAASVAFPTFKLNVSLDRIRAGERITSANVRDIIGKVSFTPHEYAKIIQVPEQLVEDQIFPIMSYLAEEIALQSAEDEEGLFLFGTGKNEPYGVLTAPIINKQIAGAGVAVSPEDIKGLPYELRVPFRRSASWMFNRYGLQNVSKMRDNIGGAGTGQFLWQMGMQAGQPDTLCGYPIMESEFFPNAFNGPQAIAGTQICLFGDWRQYWIIDRLSLTVRRLDELYAEESMIGFKYRKRFDGAPVRLEAFVELVRK